MYQHSVCGQRQRQNLMRSNVIHTKTRMEISKKVSIPGIEPSDLLIDWLDLWIVFHIIPGTFR